LTAFAHSYAQAFLGTAPEGYDLQGFFQRAESLRRAFAQQRSLKAFFSSPAVAGQAKERALEDLGHKVGLDEFGRRFLSVLLAHRRLLELGPILTALRDDADRASGVVQALLTVAAPIAEAERVRLTQALSRAVGREVRLQTTVDEGIVGGFVARVGSQVFDASVRRAVEQFGKQSAVSE
jgi:F-type H+-transporting ATPase subunit delta